MSEANKPKVDLNMFYLSCLTAKFSSNTEQVNKAKEELSNKTYPGLEHIKAKALRQPRAKGKFSPRPKGA